MGLDMYLRASKYVGGWKHSTDEERNEYERMVELFGMKEFVDEGSPWIDVTFLVGYWRKANAVHRWFVRECQDGKDECQKTPVGIDQLLVLKGLCDHALGVREKVGVNVKAAIRTAVDVLPPESGFFFGTTEVDDWYWQDLEHTVTVVDRCIALDARPNEYWDFEYHSSW